MDFKENTNYNNAVIQAYDLATLVMKDKGGEAAQLIGMESLLHGLMLYEVEVKNGEGHNVSAVIDGIFKYKKENPNSNIDILLDKTLTRLITQGRDLITLQRIEQLFQILELLKKKQLQEEIPFHVDIIKHLKEISYSLSNPQYKQKLIESWRRNEMSDDLEEWYNTKINRIRSK